MKPERPLLLEDATEEVAALIATLHATGQRLEQLTAGEVDAVADRDGRTFVLGRAQEQLRHIEATKQAAILNALPAYIALLDSQGIILSVNEAWRRFGAAATVQCPGHEIGVNYLDICDSANAKDSAEAHQVAEGIRAVLEGRAKSFSIEYACPSASDHRWFLMSANPLSDEQPNGAVVMHLDITLRRLTQTALAQSEDGLHRAEVMARLAHVITAANGTFEHWSETLPRLLGVEPAGLPRSTRGWLELVHPDDQPRLRAAAIEASVKKQRGELEYRLQKADGEWIHLRQTMEPLNTVAASGLRWFNTLQDVTAERLTQQSLLASESRFRQMADNIRDVFFLQNLDRSQIYYVSPAYEQIWGRSRQSLYDDPASWAQAIHPDDVQQAFAKFTAGREIGFDYEFRILRPDGEVRWIHVRGFPVMDQAGKPYRTAGVASDITERKRGADELRRSESLKGAILQTSLDCVITIDHEGKIVEFNPAAVATFGFSRERVLGKHMAELIVPPRLREAHRRGFARFLATGQGTILGRRLELEAVRADGSEFPIELAITALGAAPAQMFTAFIRDITARREAERKIRRLNRVYAVLSGINTLIVRVRDRDELFREASRIAVEHGEFRMAWIGLVDQESGEVKPVASAGDVRDFFDTAPLGINETNPGGHGLAGRAMRQKKPVISNDVQGDPRRMMKRELAERGIHSLAILPLLVGDEAIGVLALYAAETGVFDEDEMRLLLELAGDIAFAVEHIEKAHKLERMTRVNAILSGVNGAIVRIRDRQELFEETCRIAVETGGLSCAWLCVVDEAEQRLRPVASAGADGALMDLIGTRLSLRDDAPGGLGISARAVRERRAVVVNDLASDTALLFNKEHAERGIKSVAILPLSIGARVVGVFGLHAAETGFFDADEMNLLNEVAANIAFALNHIKKEKKVRRLTRVYAVLSGINTLIVRVRDRDELFREACRIAVEHGKFKMAWIGVVDADARQVKPMAWEGAGADYIERMPLALEEADETFGLAGSAVRGKHAIVIQDMESDPRVLLRREAAARDFHSLAMLPLMLSDTVVGVLALYAKEIGFFDESEMKLLVELAGDISFALEHIAGQHRLETLSRIRAVSSEINAAIVRIPEREALLRETARIAVEHGRFELVWIAMLDHEEHKVHPVAWPGFSPEAAHAMSWANIVATRGTLGEAMQTRKAAVRNDIETELPMGTLRQEALKQGCRSTVCLPLVVDDKVVALIALFGQGAGFFDSKELALLNEVAADVSFALQAIEKRKELEYLSYYDALTGLANRALFLERVAQYMRSATSGGHKLALFVLDLERFKNINDSLGRPAGDALLKQVSEWLTRNVADASLVARMGADQFAVVLPQVRQDGDVTRLVEKSMGAFLEHPFRLNDAVFRIALKVGVALFPDDGDNADTLFKNAEAALKRAKASGERYLFYTQEMTARTAGKLTLENQLRHALDKEEFVLHYQPKVSLASGKLTSAEALIRWNDPRTGLVPPARFVPILEETGLIHDVGRWALKKAIEDYLRWRAAGLPAVRIAVNVSPLQLRHRDFIAQVKDTIGVDAHAAAGLELELTENVIMEDVKHNIASLKAIRAMGVTIAIDDFGTGFSSLAYLSKLPVDTLKIDRSFVIDMTASSEGLALVSTIISLAHSLRLKVVAEGVETEEQARLLRLLSCDEMQGYLFSKPVPAEIFEAKFLAAPVTA